MTVQKSPFDSARSDRCVWTKWFARFPCLVELALDVVVHVAVMRRSDGDQPRNQIRNSSQCWSFGRLAVTTKSVLLSATKALCGAVGTFQRQRVGWASCAQVRPSAAEAHDHFRIILIQTLKFIFLVIVIWIHILFYIWSLQVCFMPDILIRTIIVTRFFWSRTGSPMKSRLTTSGRLSESAEISHLKSLLVDFHVELALSKD